MRFHRDPLGFLRAARDVYGEVFTLRLAVAGTAVVVADPEAAVALAGNESDAGEARRAVLPMASPGSAFGGDGAVHAAARSRLAETFSASATEDRRGAMVEIAERHVAGWPRGRPFLLLPRMRALADDVFVRLLLGVRDDERARALREAVTSMLRTPGNPPLPPPGQGDGALGAFGQMLFERRKAPLERLLSEEIESRRGQERGSDDVLDSLLGADPRLSIEEILGEVVTLLMAAQEPPSIALAWMLERLSRHPRLAAAYLAAGPEAPLRDAVLRETLRLRPSALASLRRPRTPVQVGRHLLPAGVNTMVPLPLIHRDPRFFPDPDGFRPERWLSTEEEPRLFLPFGAGARRCLGEALARAEVAAVVPAVLGSVKLRPLWPRPERMVLRGTVLVPHRGVPVLAA